MSLHEPTGRKPKPLVLEPGQPRRGPRKGIITEAEAIRRLALACAAVGGQSAWARKHGMSHSNLWRVLTGEKPMSEAIAATLGLKRVFYFERMDEEEKQKGMQ